MFNEIPFVNRVKELGFLNRLLSKRRASRAEFLLLYGRRRVGKTSLLQKWASESGLPFTYWSAEKEPASLQRRKLLAKVWRVDMRSAPLTKSWSEAWEQAGARIGSERHILILDELPYASESDPALLSSLQHAWDQVFQRSNMVVCLCGSHVRTMDLLMARQSPLFGRLTGQWQLQALPFTALSELFPRWTAEERIALWGIAGGIPAYLSWLDPARSLAANIDEEILDPGGLFMAEPMLLLYDEVREPAPHLAVLKAIGRGCHSLEEISSDALIGKNNLSIYLSRLQELRLVERRLPVTVQPNAARISRKGRYHLSDAFFRFYFRFIAPEHERLTHNHEAVRERTRTELRGFLSVSAFEPLARAWMEKAGKQGLLSFIPEYTGAHWSARAQVDAVGINWSQECVAVGECKWGLDKVDRQVATELLEVKIPALLADLPLGGEGWRVTPLLFARRGVTPAAADAIRAAGGLCVTGEELERTLLAE